MAIQLKRVYEAYSSKDGYRILVDRLWPRGIKKEDAHIDKWAKEISPSNELRKWYHSHLEMRKEFATKYRAELKGTNALKEFIELLNEHKTVTFLYASKDTEHNHAQVLKEIVEQ